MHRFMIPMLLAAGVSACADGPAQGDTNQAASAVQPTASASTAIPLHDKWLGRWIGVEGLNLTIAKTPTAGRYLLKMQYGTDAGTAGTFEGIATAEGISFSRPDGRHVLRATTGNQTGLKYLAGKPVCLKVKDGEGYCRS